MDKSPYDWAADAEASADRAELALREIQKIGKPEKETDGWSVLGTVLGFCAAVSAIMLTIKLGLTLF